MTVRESRELAIDAAMDALEAESRAATLEAAQEAGEPVAGPQPAAAPVMPSELAFDEKIVWQVTHGEDRPCYIADAVGEHQGQVTQRLRSLVSMGRLVERTEMGRSRFSAAG